MLVDDIMFYFAHNITHDIICKMEDNIDNAVGYLAELAGGEITTTPTAKREVDKLPMALSSGYSFCDIDMSNTAITLAIPKEEEDNSPMQLSKRQIKMMDILGRPVVFVLDNMESYNLTRLTRARVNFIVPGKVIFIPSLMMVLRDIKSAPKKMPDMMPPVAQLLVLYHIQVERLDGMNTAKIAKVMGLAYPTINLALKWLAKNSYIALEGGKEKQVSFTLQGKELWEKTLPLMSSPIERIVYSEAAIADSLLSGETAMGHYTMLAEPTTPIVAISKTMAKKNEALMNKQHGDYRIEIWKYNPALLSKGEQVDRLSLYLSLKDSDDERVQKECDTLIDEMKW